MGNTPLAGKEVIPIPRRQTKAKRHGGKMEKRRREEETIKWAGRGGGELKGREENWREGEVKHSPP